MATLMVTTMEGPYPANPSAEMGTAIAWNNASGAGTADTWPPQVGDIILIHNRNEVGSSTVTLVSQPDSHGRTGDGVQDVAAGEYYVIGPLGNLDGWINPGTKLISISADEANATAQIQIAILRRPG